MQTVLESEQTKVPPATKSCPYCAETILLQAVKCKHCGEFLDQPTRRTKPAKWMYSTSAVVLGLLTLGPLALPLVWFNPRWKWTIKSIITFGVITLTFLLCYASAMVYSNMINRITSLGL